MTSRLARRTFLIGAGAVGATVAIPVATASAQDSGSGGTCADDCETMTVWRLDPDWGYARGPHNKTKLESNASRQAAKNRWALTKRDALDMNLHKCSWAPAVPVEVDKCAFMEIWDHNGAGSYEWKNPWNQASVQIFDERCLPHIDDSGELWKKALNPQCGTSDQESSGANGGSSTNASTSNSSTTNSSTTRHTYPTGGFVWGGTSSTTNSARTSTTTTTSSGRSAAGQTDRPQQALAFTGGSTLKTTAVGTGLAAVGGAFAVFARRREQVAREEQEASNA